MSARRTRPAGSSKKTSGKWSRSCLRAMCLRRREPLFAQAFEPEEMLILGHQRIRQAVSGEIDQPHIRIGQVETGEDVIGLERLPGSVGRGLEEARQWAGMHQQIGLAIAAHVAEPHSGLRQRDAGRNLGHGCEAGPTDRRRGFSSNEIRPDCCAAHPASRRRTSRPAPHSGSLSASGGISLPCAAIDW